MSIKFRKQASHLLQVFELEGSKSTINILHDKRFDLHDKFEDKVREVMLSNQDGITFISRIDEDNKITIEYELRPDVDKKYINYFFVIPCFMPPAPTCEYCSNAEHRGDFIFCTVKNKTITTLVKRCTVFKQNNKLFKT